MPVSIKSLYEKTAATLYFHNIAAAFLHLEFGVATTPIHLFTCYTTPLCKALFRENVPNWCSPSVVPQMLLEVRSKFHRICALILHFTAQSASSWGQVKEGSQMALFPFVSLSMRLPFSCSRTSSYATLHNLPAIWCKSGVVVGVVDFRPKCPICRSDLQRNGLWLPWWLPRKSPSWC